MATGGSLVSGKRFHLPTSAITVTLSDGDIMDTSADAVATGEDSGLQGQGIVSSLLLKSCPKAYKSARDQLKKHHSGRFDTGQIYPCNFPNIQTTKGQKGLSFSVVLHAIVPSAREYSKEKEWINQMEKLYYRLFQAANRHGRASLALPLLGSGGAKASVDTAVNVLAHALVTFRLDHKRANSGKSLKDIIVYARKEAFSKMTAKLQESLKGVELPNGVRTHSSTRPASHGSCPRGGSTRGRVGLRNSEGIRKPASRGAAVKSTHMIPPEDQENSNLDLIMRGLTLESKIIANSSKQEEEKEEDMETEDVDQEDDEDDKKKEEEEEDDRCPICLDEIDNPKKLDKCGHTFCTDCIESSFRNHKPACPTCNTMYGMITGNQPRGTMEVRQSSSPSVPGYNNCGIIVIDYSFPSGTQGPEHPNPGTPYSGTRRRAFLPDCPEGKKVCRLLRVAFDNRLTFTIGRSRTTGAENVVTWNDIHHKTSIDGGTTNFGYPDPHYLSRVQEELAAKGVTAECLQGRSFDI